jgi:hypothetical protein
LTLKPVAQEDRSVIRRRRCSSEASIPALAVVSIVALSLAVAGLLSPPACHTPSLGSIVEHPLALGPACVDMWLRSLLYGAYSDIHFSLCVGDVDAVIESFCFRGGGIMACTFVFSSGENPGGFVAFHLIHRHHDGRPIPLLDNIVDNYIGCQSKKASYLYAA